jgi:hypothetical protein
MATQLSKADRIRKLLHLSNAEIAKREACHEGYVRAVRQRTSSDGHPIQTRAEKAWQAANWGRLLQLKREANARRWASDPKYRKHKLEQQRKWRQENPDYASNYMRAYRAKRRVEARAS